MASELWLREDLQNVLLALWASYVASGPRPEDAIIYGRALFSMAVAIGIPERELQPLALAARGLLEARR